MGDDNKPIEGSPIDTAAGIAAPSPGYSYGLTTTFTTTYTTTLITTSIPSIMFSEAAFTTTKLILIPVIKLLKK